MAFTPVVARPLLGGLDSLRMDSMRGSIPQPSSAGPVSASGGQLSSRLEQQLSCAICLERYDEPRILKCSHSFCRRCLASLLERRAADPENPQRQLCVFVREGGREGGRAGELVCVFCGCVCVFERKREGGREGERVSVCLLRRVEGA